MLPIDLGCVEQVKTLRNAFANVPFYGFIYSFIKVKCRKITCMRIFLDSYDRFLWNIIGRECLMLCCNCDPLNV